MRSKRPKTPEKPLEETEAGCPAPEDENAEKRRIPKDKAYSDLTEEEKKDLDRLIEKSCRYHAFKLYYANGDADWREVKTDLKTHAYLVLERLKKENKRKGANLGSYMHQTIEREKNDIISRLVAERDKKSDILQFPPEDRRSALTPEEALLEKEEEERIKEKARPIIDLIAKCCRKTDTHVNPDDWVATAFKLLRSRKRKTLSKDLRLQLDKLESQFMENGYAPKRPVKVTKAVRDIVDENPKASSAEIKKKLDQMNISYNENSIAPIASQHRRKALGQPRLNLGRSRGARNRVKELMEDGVSDRTEIRRILMQEKMYCDSALLHKYMREFEVAGPGAG